MKKRFILTIITVLALLAGITGSVPFAGAQDAQQIHNLLVLIELSGEQGYFDGQKTEDILQAYNAGEKSVNAYFDVMSRGQTDITTTLAGTYYAGNITRGMLEPYHETGNPDGWLPPADGNATSFLHAAREHILAKRAAEQVLSAYFAENAADGLAKYDVNGDYSLDMVTFLVSGEQAATTDNPLLWPHKWQVYSGNVYRDTFGEEYNAEKILGENAAADRATLESKLYFSGGIDFSHYILMGEALTQSSGGGTGAEAYRTGVFVHESVHLLDIVLGDSAGMPLGVDDLYVAEGDDMPVGAWDIMGVTHGSFPQGLNAWYRYKLGWLTEQEIPFINVSGAHALSHTLAESGVAALRFGNKYGQFFVAELRQKTGWIDSALPGVDDSGLIVYRVDTNVNADRNSGNLYPPYEVEIIYDGGRTHPEFAAALVNAGDSLGTDERYAQHGLVYRLEDDTLENSRIVLTLAENEGGEAQLELALEPAEYDASGVLLDNEGQPVAGARIYVEGVFKAVTAADGSFSLKVTRGDIVTFTHRTQAFADIDTAALELTDGDYSLGEITGAQKPERTVEVVLRDGDGTLLHLFAFSAALGGKRLSLVTDDGGVAVISELFDGDVLELNLGGFSFFPARIVIDGQPEQPVEITVYANYSVSGVIYNENGGIMTGRQVSIFIDGKYAGETNDGTFSLTNLPHGSVVTFESRSYNYGNIEVMQDMAEVRITAEKKPGVIRVPAAAGLALVAVLVIAVYYYIVIDSRRKYKYRRPRRR